MGFGIFVSDDNDEISENDHLFLNANCVPEIGRISTY
jgi:hypothetical protein